MIPDVYPKSHNRIVGAFIAGGYAVAPAQANDIDIWVKVSAGTNMPVVKQHIQQYLIDQYGLDLVTKLEDGREFGTTSGDYHEVFETLKVATVKLSNNLSYHVMMTTGDIFDVVNSFDLSICQVGIDELGLTHKGEDYTPPYGRILVVKDTPTTYDRMLKYMERFNVPGDHAYIDTIEWRRQFAVQLAQFEEDHLGVVAEKETACEECQ